MNQPLPERSSDHLVGQSRPGGMTTGVVAAALGLTSAESLTAGSR